MDQGNGTGNQQKPLAAEPFPKKPVVTTVAMARVADDRMGHMIEVPTDLMTPSSLGRNID